MYIAIVSISGWIFYQIYSISSYVGFLFHPQFFLLMVQYPQVSRHYFILQNCAIWDINVVSVVGNNDNSSF